MESEALPLPLAAALALRSVVTATVAGTRPYRVKDRGALHHRQVADNLEHVIDALEAIDHEEPADAS